MSEQKVSQVTQAQVARDFDNVAGDYEAKINSAIAFAGMEQKFYIDIKREHILRLGREHFSNTRIWTFSISVAGSALPSGS